MTHTLPRRGQPTKRKADPRRGRRLSTADEKRIIDAYNAGVSIHGIVSTFGYNRNAVRRILRTSPEVQLRDDACKPKISTPDLIKRYHEGWTPRMIADASGAEIRTIHKRLSELNLPLPGGRSELPAKAIVKAYAAGKSLTALGAEHGAARETIRRVVADAGALRPASSPPRVSPLKLADLCRRGMSVPQMSKATGLQAKTLRKYLTAAGLRAADTRPGRERPPVIPAELGGGGKR